MFKKYGQKKESLHPLLIKGAYAPEDLSLIQFIDYGILASFESLSSLISSKLSYILKKRSSSNESKSKESSLV